MKQRRNVFRHPVVVVTIAAAGLAVLLSLAFRPKPINELLEEGRQALRKRHVDKALQLADQLLQRSADRRDVYVLAIDAAIASEDTELALKRIDQLVQRFDEPEYQILAAQMVHENLARLNEAESRYLAILARRPDQIPAMEGLARLYATCGRRWEAIPHILEMIRRGAASDLITVLARESGAIRDDEMLDRALKADPNCAPALLGRARVADMEGDLDGAIEFCRQAVLAQPGLAAGHAELGRTLQQSGRREELKVWDQQLPESALTHPGVQKVRGQLAVSQGDFAGAFEQLVLSARQSPDSKEVCFQLSQLLYSANEKELADQFAQQIVLIQELQELQDRVLFGSMEISPDGLVPLLEKFEECGRLYEAFGWAQQACARFGDPPRLILIRDRLQRLVATEPVVLIRDLANPALKLDAVELARRLESRGSPDPQNSGTAFMNSATLTASESRLRFEAQADSIGFSFSYQNAGGIASHRMFSYTGGGVGILDFDGDSYPDVFLTQGGPSEKPGASIEASDMLLRNLQGLGFVDVTDLAGVRDADFSQGVACGDFNNDGFSDIAVAGVGFVHLWQNNGDGTLTRQSLQITESLQDDDWFTSLAIADVNQDSCPDLYVVGYLAGQDVMSAVCEGIDGRPETCSPAAFNSARDLFLLSDGTGNFREVRDDQWPKETDGKGLGVLVFDATETNTLSIFVANDTTANTLLVHQSDETWTDEAFASGLAVSATGKAEGCMGIAAGDADRDGRQDLVVTNFLFESHGYFRNLGRGFFRDDRSIAELQTPSFNVLGFGVQFLDADLDGSLELFVANGHIDDLARSGKPFRMPPQVFVTRAGTFALAAPDTLGTYFQSRHLGRAVARCDWNADLHPDLVVGHLEEATVMLTNQSETAGSGFSLQVIGIQTSRDGVGATVRIQAGSERWSQQVTAGDGYQCSNEKRLLFGLGPASSIDELTVQWPNSELRTFSEVAINSRSIVIEGRDRIYHIPQ